MNKVISPSDESGPVRSFGLGSLVAWLIRHPAADSGLTQRTAILIFFMPLLIILACILIILPPATRPWYHWLVAENRPVEIATFLFLLASGIGGFALTVRFASRGARFAACFYAVFSLGILLIAMEEIAWGQHLFGFRTPENWAALNVQRETTLHNLETLQGHNDYLRLIFGFGGLTGIFLGRFWRRIVIVCPDRLLLPWFLSIFGISSGQVLSDLVSHIPIARPLVYFDQLAEVVELLIGISAMLYLWLNARKYGPGRAGGGASDAQKGP